MTAVSSTPRDGAGFDPIALLRGLAGLRRLTGMYPAGHPAIEQKLSEVYDAVQRYLRGVPVLRLDVIHGQAYVDGLVFRSDDGQGEVLRDLADLGINSIHLRAGITREELLSLSEFLWQYKAGSGEPVDVQLAARRIHHVSLGRLVPLDTRWRATEWPDAPTDVLDPSYAESIALTEQTFNAVAAGDGLNLATVRHVVELLMRKVVGSSAALAQILAVKFYENLTYCHSVNVAALSLLIGRQLGFDERLAAALGEAALLHDIGKTRIPLDVLRKPGGLDRLERRLMESHTTLGAEILVELDGIQPLTPVVALEHHRGLDGTGYPDLGAGAPHVLSQVVSVADIYEAMTGARSYQDPAMPEQACLVLARLAGTKLNAAIVKAFVNAVSFFPVGSVVRTDRDELGVVVRVNDADPLHPVFTRVGAGHEPLDEIDSSLRDAAGVYERHVIETIAPPQGLELAAFFANA